MYKVGPEGNSVPLRFGLRCY